MGKYTGRQIASSLAIKLAEQLSVKLTTFIVSIVLARILDVEAFGVVAILLVFTNLATSVIEGGMSTSLIQRRDVSDVDYSTVFWLCCVVALVLYVILCFAAPHIADFYAQPEIAEYLRALGLVLFAAPFNTVQLGYVYRNMLFKRLLAASLAAAFVSGLIGIGMALIGLGIWALVAQSVSSSLVSVLVLFFLIPWHPKALFSLKVLKSHFAYGWKLLLASILETLDVELRNLVVGSRFSAEALSLYNRGDMYPKTVIVSLNTAVQSVLLPVLASEQLNKESLRRMTREAVTKCSYLLFPVMAVFAASAQALVTLLLTEKWLACVPFLQLACLTYAFRPVNSCNLQALKAIGRSDIYLVLDVVKIALGFAILLVAAYTFDDPIAVAIAMALYSPVQLIINIYPNIRLIGYSLGDQLRDIAPSAALSLAVFAAVLPVGSLPLPCGAVLALQCVSGVALYAGLSALFRVRAFYLFLSVAKRAFIGRGGRKA